MCLYFRSYFYQLKYCSHYSLNLHVDLQSKADKDYDIDDLFMEQTTSNRNKKEKDMQTAIDKHKSTERALDNCKWCLTNNKLQKHLIIATGSKVSYYLSFFDDGSLLFDIQV